MTSYIMAECMYIRKDLHDDACTECSKVSLCSVLVHACMCIYQSALISSGYPCPMTCLQYIVTL